LRNSRFTQKQLCGDPRPDELSDLLRRYAEGKAVAELGCGQGDLARSLRGVCRSYVGTDISWMAIALARDQAAASERFEVGRMEDWRPTPDVELVLAGDTFHHMSRRAQAETFRHIRDTCPDAVMLLVIGSPQGRAALIAQASAAGRVLERAGSSGRLVLALGKWRAPAAAAVPDARRPNRNPEPLGYRGAMGQVRTVGEAE
jgi:SAM-dependent methyltransferase